MGLTTSTVVNGVALRIEPSRSTTIQRANSNYPAKSRATHNNNSANAGAFGFTDDVVVMLDAQWDALEDKDPWNAYAAAISGTWGACTNCDMETTAKKLFRCVNLNRIMLGLVSSPVVPDNAVAYYGQLGEVTYHGPQHGADRFSWFGNVESPSDAILIALCNLGTANPRVQTQIIPDITFYGNSTPEYAFSAYVAELVGLNIFGQVNPIGVPTCVIGPEGQVGPGPWPVFWDTEENP